MAGPDFYKILGVSPSASADEIKSAHRELVKKYHPDLFPSSPQKARANKKLQEINEAYSILSNPERRRQYDSRFFQKAHTIKPEAAATKRRSGVTPRRPSPVRTWETLVDSAKESLRQIAKACENLSIAAQTYYQDLSQKARAAKRAAAATQSTSAPGQRHSAAAMAWRNFARRWTERIAVKMTAGILGLMILVLILQAAWKEPETTIAWALLESTVVEPPQNSSEPQSGERKWSALGYHGSKALCAQSLKQQVMTDAQGGGKVFLDERSGTIAMTIYGKSESALAEEYFNEKLKQGSVAGVDRQLLEKQAKQEAEEFIRKNGMIQRVKHYQCRETEIVKPESWLRTKLRRLGLVS